MAHGKRTDGFESICSSRLSRYYLFEHNVVSLSARHWGCMLPIGNDVCAADIAPGDIEEGDVNEGDMYVNPDLYESRDE